MVKATPMAAGPFVMGVPLVTATQLGAHRLVVDSKMQFVAEAGQQRVI